MRPLQLAIRLLAVFTLTGWGWPHNGDAEWPQAGPMPDDSVKIRPYRYESITKGLQSYRPIAPMPWGDVNRRVAPSGALQPAPQIQPLQKGGVAPLAMPPEITVPTAPAMPGHGNHGMTPPKQ